jgi:hypothetical protein
VLECIILLKKRFTSRTSTRLGLEGNSYGEAVGSDDVTLPQKLEHHEATSWSFEAHTKLRQTSIRHYLFAINDTYLEDARL